jgi:DNA polymerase-1
MDLSDLAFGDRIKILESAEIITVDTEGVNPMMGFSFCVKGMNRGLYLPFHHTDGPNLSPGEQKHVLSVLAKKTLVHHNAAHDVAVLEDEGLTEPYEFYDTMLMAYWINEEMLNYSLDSVSKAYGGAPKNRTPAMDAIIEEKGWHAIPLNMMDKYSSNDSWITDNLFYKLLPEFQKQFSEELWKVEQDFIRYVIIPMKRRGVKVDLNFCVKEYMRGDVIMSQLRQELGFNPTSPLALKKFLIDELGLPVVSHTKACKKCYPEVKYHRPDPVYTHQGKPSFDKAAMELYDQLLEKQNDDRARKVLTYRGWQKTNSSNYKAYLRLADLDGVLRPSYKLHGTRTRRLSCEDPNLQQIPKHGDNDWNGGLKRAFVPRDDFNLWTVDYKQLQFRMTCAYGRIQKLIDIFNDPTRDIFTEMAKDMGWVRDDVKTQVYLTIFGGGAQRASVAFAIPIEQAKEVVEEFHGSYPEIREIANDCKAYAQKHGYVQYWTGQRRHFWKGSKGHHKAFNAAIQGGEAEIVKRAMIRIAREICDENCFIILQIHDEVVLEIREGMEDQYLPRIQKVMEEVPKDFCKIVGVDVKFGADAKPWGAK